MENKLNELTDAIRKAIPRLMELSEGCEIISKIVDYFNNIEIESNFIIGKNAEFDGEDIVIGEYCYGLINFTIIGHEPLLNDVLEWLKIKSEIVFGFNDKRLYDHFKVWKLNDWDLSKSKLSDQSEQLINFLHGLIQNK